MESTHIIQAQAPPSLPHLSSPPYSGRRSDGSENRGKGQRDRKRLTHTYAHLSTSMLYAIIQVETTGKSGVNRLKVLLLLLTPPPPFSYPPTCTWSDIISTSTAHPLLPFPLPSSSPLEPSHPHLHPLPPWEILSTMTPLPVPVPLSRQGSSKSQSSRSRDSQTRPSFHRPEGHYIRTMGECFT